MPWGGGGLPFGRGKSVFFKAVNITRVWFGPALPARMRMQVRRDVFGTP
jgi:hypothetical protein